MLRCFALLVVGFLAGAVSWGVVALVSDRFEPFDSGLGFAVGQLVLSGIAIAVGYKKKLTGLFAYLGGAYLGMNAYAYNFGSSEQRAWALLGLVTSVALIVVPLIFGVVGRVVSGVGKNRRNATSRPTE